MSVGDVIKWALLGVVVLVLWRWVRNGISANIGPGYPNNVYSVQQGGGGYTSGFIPFNGGKSGGLTFGLNFPWNVNQFMQGQIPAYGNPALYQGTAQ